MADNGLLRNAPLVEVIAEIHWKLSGSRTPGGQGHDPRWFGYANRFADWARTQGFEHIEQLVPAGVSIPLDMLGHNPLLRFRKQPGTWPLIQLGQGLLAVNAVPPYDGWHGAVVVSEDDFAKATKALSQGVKDDIAFAHARVKSRPRCCFQRQEFD